MPDIFGVYDLDDHKVQVTLTYKQLGEIIKVLEKEKSFSHAVIANEIFQARDDYYFETVEKIKSDKE